MKNATVHNCYEEMALAVAHDFEIFATFTWVFAILGSLSYTKLLHNPCHRTPTCAQAHMGVS